MAKAKKPIDVKTNIYPIWKALFMSFYSAGLYKDVGKNWKGMGVQYTFLLGLIVCIAITFSWLRTLYKLDVNEFAQSITQEVFKDPSLSFEESLNRVLNIISQVPEVSLHDGALGIKGSDTVFITDPVTLKNLAVIDTSGKYNTLKDTDGAKLLVTRTRLIFKNEHGVDETANFSNLKENYALSEEDFNLYINIIAQIPLIKIIDGKASIGDLLSPYTIMGKDDRPLALIDLVGTTTSLEGTKALVLLTEDKLFIKHPLSGEITQVYLSQIDEKAVLSSIASTLRNMRKIITWMIPVFVTPIFVVIFIACAFLMSFFYGTLGMLMAKFFKMPPLRLETNIRLAAVAITPIIAFNMLLPNIFSNQGLIYFLIAIGYIYFALKANAEEGI
jgi:hypothetical protein